MGCMIGTETQQNLNWKYSQLMPREMTYIHTRDQQWIAFLLLISTHEILSIYESTVLKYNYYDPFVLTTTLIYKYRLQWAWVQHWH